MEDAKDDVIIRPYHPSDIDQIHECYQEAFETLAPAFFRAFLFTPTILVPMVSIGLGIGKASRKPLLGLASLIFQVGLLHRYIRKGFREYIRESQTTDLSNIDTVYGGNGVFLVAVQQQQQLPSIENGNGSTSSEKIIGTVGCQDVQEKEGAGVFELRRMSVSSKARNLGIGSRLIAALEYHVKPKKVVLTCSNIQYAAHRLYAKNGFVLLKKFIPDDAPILFRQAFLVWSWEKVIVPRSQPQAQSSNK